MNKIFDLKNSPKKISHKFIFMVTIVLLVTMGAANYFNHQSKVNNLREQLEIRGKSLGDFLALTSSDAVLGQDYLLMERYMKEISHQPDVVYGVILAANGNNLTSYLNHDNETVSNAYTEDFMATLNNINANPDVFSMHFPIGTNEKVGSIILGFSTKNIDRLSQTTLQQEIIEISLIIIFIGICIFLLFNISVLKPIQNLIYSLRCVAGGNLYHKAKIFSNDELGTLANSFNQMTESLNQIHHEKDNMVDELLTSNTKLEYATKAKSVFLANMSHEIRTPLTAIIGFGNHLKNPDITEDETAHALNSIVDNGIHLKHIINDILDISKIEADKLAIEKSDASLFDVFNDIESLFSLQCKEHDLTYSIDYIFPLPEKINTDVIRFKQILINLYSNAIKFTHSGGVTISVSYNIEDKLLYVDVKDTGIGLSPEQQEKIFSPFTQADLSTNRKYGGTGLGLSLSYKLAEMLGGAIKVKSVLDVGSCFSVSIDPGDINANQFTSSVPIRNELTTTETNIAATLNQLAGSILLAEDNIYNQELISIYVSNTSATLDIADDGAQAVELASNKEYDLILMDMQMPNMDGIEAITILRKNGYTKPISALTANAMQQDKDQFTKAGSNDFLSKPIDENAFYLLLEKYLPSVKDRRNNKSKSIKDLPSFQRIKDKFISSLNLRYKEIYDAYDSKNWDELYALLHSLKGVSGNLGLEQIMMASIDAENEVITNEKTELMMKIENLNQAIENVIH